LQERLLFEAAVSLVGNPKLEDEEDETRRSIVEAAEAVAQHDPEFVVKVYLVGFIGEK